MSDQYKSYIVDTHVLLWFLAGDKRLSQTVKSILESFRGTLILPATALAEAFWIVQTGKLPIAVEHIIRILNSDSRFVVYPLDRQVIEKCNSLTTIREMHDRQIVATTLVHSERNSQIAILTRDKNISESALVPVVW